MPFAPRHLRYLRPGQHCFLLSGFHHWGGAGVAVLIGHQCDEEQDLQLRSNVRFESHLVVRPQQAHEGLPL